MMYNVKINLDITYDKNYKIEANSEEWARALAASIAKEAIFDAKIASPSLTDWETSMHEWGIAYVEESAHNEELTDGEVLDLVYDWVKKWDDNTNKKSSALLELKQILQEHEE